MLEKNLATDKKAAAASHAGSRKNLVTDLDFSVLPGIRIAREVCAEVLAASGIELDDPLFSRCFVCLPASEAVAELAKKSGNNIDVSATVKTIEARIEDRLADPEVAPRADVVKALQTLRKNGARLLFATTQPEEAAAAHVARLDLGEADAIFTVNRGERLLGYDAGAWQRVVQRMGLNRRRVVILTSDAISCKSAIMSDIRAVALTEPLTDFQDYSGVHAKLASADKLADIIGGLLKLDPES